MEKNPTRLILLVILVVVVIQLLLNFLFVSPNLKHSLIKLNEAKASLDSARAEVKQSRKNIDSIRLNLMKFNNYVIAIQSTTEILYKDRALKEAKFKTERDSILNELKLLYQAIDTLDLPPLTVYDSRQPRQ